MNPTAQRIEFLDFARGLALVAMTIFHFAFDLELFGFQERGFITQPHWKYFARVIATSFLIVTGISLYLAHQNGVSWPNWRKRMTMIAGAALAITVATYFATPDQYIFFGILHQIAFASVAGLLFLKLPWLITMVIGIGVFWVGQSLHLALFDPVSCLVSLLFALSIWSCSTVSRNESSFFTFKIKIPGSFKLEQPGNLRKVPT